MNPTALITGASSGIGKEFARIHAKNGGNLILAARTTRALIDLQKELQASYSIEVAIITIDLSKPDAAQTLYNEVKCKNLSVDILINNAGYGEWGPFAQSANLTQSLMIAVNCTALLELTQLFLPAMIAQKNGKILNVASTASFQPGPYMAVYYATKAFVLSFSEALDFELHTSGISVTALCPGPTQSNFQNVANIGHLPLIAAQKLPSSNSVAAIGYKAMMRGKRIAIPGFMNNLLVWSVRFTPRNFVTAFVARLQQAREKKH